MGAGATDVSIAITARDGYTDAVKKMQESTKAFGKSTDALGDKLKWLDKQMAPFKSSLTAAKNELKEYQKAFKATGSEMDGLKMQLAQENVDNMSRSLNLMTKEAKGTEKAMQGMIGTASKAENQGMLQSLSQAGLFNMAGQALTGLGSGLITSAMGSEAGGAINSILGGIASGASIGMIAGPQGAAIGAAVGAATGLANAVTSSLTSRDEAFKGLVQEQYNAAKEQQAKTLTSGSAIAGGRELTKMAFSQLLGGEEAATQYLEQVRDMAARTNYAYDDITGYTKKLLNSYDPDDIFGVLTTLSDTAAGLSLKTEDTDMLVNGLNRMRITNKATQEYLNYFMERGVDVYAALAKGLNVDENKIAKMVTRGKITGSQAAEYILAYMEGEYGGLSATMMGSFSGLTDNLADLQADVDAAMGEGYNQARKVGLVDQQSFLSGDSGDQMKEAYRLIGGWQAEQENQKEYLLRDAYRSTMESDEFLTADAITKGQMLMQAQVDAQAAYLASDGYQLQLEADKALVNSTQAAMVPVYESAGYALGQEFSKGLMAAKAEFMPGFFNIDMSTSRSYGANDDGSPPLMYGRAFGMHRIPYDGFPMFAHEGERLLTAAQARAQDAGVSGGGMPPISGNNFYIREEADVDRVAQAIVRELRSVQASYVGE